MEVIVVRAQVLEEGLDEEGDEVSRLDAVYEVQEDDEEQGGDEEHEDDEEREGDEEQVAEGVEVE